MTNSVFIRSTSRHRAALWVAALLVPSRKRAEWLAEWRSELWYVQQESCRQSSTLSAQGKLATRFCMGAFKDAFWAMRYTAHEYDGKKQLLKSPIFCLLLLTLLATCCSLAAYYMPEVRKSILPQPFHDKQNIVFLSSSKDLDYSSLAVSAESYRSWRNQTGPQIADVAFYESIIERVQIAQSRSEDLTIAIASDNLLKTLNLQIPLLLLNKSKSMGAEPLILSRSALERFFGSNPNSIGLIVNVGKRKGMIVGIMPDESWQLPDTMDAWLLMDEQSVNALSSRSWGFVVAHAHPSAFSDYPNEDWQFTVPNDDGSSRSIHVVSIAKVVQNNRQQPIVSFFHVLILALVVLPIFTALSLGDCQKAHNSSWTTMLRPWLFFFSKILLVLPIVFLSALIVAHLDTSLSLEAGLALQCLVAFVGCLYTLSWAFKDQRQRCPRCLRLMSNPIQVGQSSRILLSGRSSEFRCTRGHGLLHIPEFPTSWFSAQSWHYFSSSWNGLYIIRPSL